jgi:hypothetical protein
VENGSIRGCRPEWRSPTISGQRLTTLDWTNPNLRNAVRPISGISSPTARAGPPRGRSYAFALALSPRSIVAPLMP